MNNNTNMFPKLRIFIAAAIVVSSVLSTSAPTAAPTASPTNAPTASPTASPTNAPTASPTNAPTASPTASPTNAPTALPTASPTNAPTASPSGQPTVFPTTRSALTLEFDEFYANVKGQSGKIEIGYRNSSVQITMDSLKERDSDGNLVKNTGPPSEKHSFNSFATQDFQFSSPYTKVFAGGAEAYAIDFTSTLFAKTKILVSIYIVSAPGNISYGGVDYPVQAGSFKFAYNISQWPFCTADGTDLEFTLCQGAGGAPNEVGASLDFELIVKSSASLGDANSNTATNVFTNVDYQDGTEFVIPHAYFADTTWTDMPDGFPSLSVSGDKTTVIYRFDRFEEDCFYDPTLTFATTENLTNAPTAAPTTVPTAAPTSAPTAAPTTAPTASPTAISGSCPIEATSKLANGKCDDEYNTAECGFDGGDCCYESCIQNPSKKARKKCSKGGKGKWGKRGDRSRKLKKKDSDDCKDPTYLD